MSAQTPPTVAHRSSCAPIAPGSGVGLRQTLVEHGLHLAAESRVQHDRVEFVIVQEAAPAEVGGTHSGPDTIDQRRLGMQYHAAPFDDLHTGAQQAPVLGPSGMEHPPRIGL